MKETGGDAGVRLERFLNPKHVFLVGEKPTESVWREKDKLGR